MFGTKSQDRTAGQSTSTARRIRKAAITLALTSAITTALVGTTATPSLAASYEKACFKWTSGAAYKNQPVYLNAWQNGKWTSIRKGSTNSYGCAAFSNVPTGAYTTIHAYAAYGNADIGMALFSGWAPSYANPGHFGINLGTSYVRLHTCTEGLYDYCAGLR